MRIALLSMLVILQVAVGCSRVDPPSRGRADVTDHRNIFFSQADRDRLRTSTAILEERITRDEFGLMTVVVPIRSEIRHTLYLEYQFEFYDQAGRRVEGPIGWQPITLEAGSPGTIQFTSTSPAAADYRVTIRFAR